MPNARSKKKKLVGGYVNYKLKHAIKEIALADGRLITPQLARHYFAIVPKAAC